LINDPALLQTLAATAKPAETDAAETAEGSEE
jgi:hypothetical protein